MSEAHDSVRPLVDGDGDSLMLDNHWQSPPPDERVVRYQEVQEALHELYDVLPHYWQFQPYQQPANFHPHQPHQRHPSDPPLSSVPNPHPNLTPLRSVNYTEPLPVPHHHPFGDFRHLPYPYPSRVRSPPPPSFRAAGGGPQPQQQHPENYHRARYFHTGQGFDHLEHAMSSPTLAWPVPHFNAWYSAEVRRAAEARATAGTDGERWRAQHTRPMARRPGDSTIHQRLRYEELDSPPRGTAPRGLPSLASHIGDTGSGHGSTDEFPTLRVRDSLELIDEGFVQPSREYDLRRLTHEYLHAVGSHYRPFLPHPDGPSVTRASDTPPAQAAASTAFNGLMGPGQTTNATGVTVETLMSDSIPANFLRPINNVTSISTDLPDGARGPLRTMPAPPMLQPAFEGVERATTDDVARPQGNDPMPDAGERLPAHRPGHRRRMSRPPTSRVPCTACLDELPPTHLHDLACGCRYCITCLNAAFRAGCANMGSFPPKCCGTPLRISAPWRIYLDPAVLQRYKEVEAEFGANRPLYCASAKCSAFIAEPDQLTGLEVGVCPQCRKVTCKRCKKLMDDHRSQWALDLRVCPADDAETTALLTLVTQKKWKQCPTCRHMVERHNGCPHMQCVCGGEFCYLCGQLFDEAGTCGCGPDAWTNDEEEAYDDSDDDNPGGAATDLDDSDDEHEWPDFRLAHHAPGHRGCTHVHTQPVGDEEDEFVCHGCLERRHQLNSCEVCGLELCRTCLDAARS